MELMNEIVRKKMILESRKFGGIGLRHQKLRVHKNGAKFPITKAYIDDELLDADATYTLILIPEAKIAKKSSVSLSFFKRKSGPTIFYSYPEDAFYRDEKEKLLSEIMQKAIEEGFFVYQSSNISSLNYYFEIPSDLARGKKELLMISVILDMNINQNLKEIIESVCNDFVSQLKLNKDLYKALYIKDLDTFSDEMQLDIKRISEDLVNNITDLYKCIRKISRQKLNSLSLNVSMEIQQKLDLSHIAQELDDAIFKPEKFPGLILKVENLKTTILLFSTGKMVITGLNSMSEGEQVVENFMNNLNDIGIEVTNPKISISGDK